MWSDNETSEDLLGFKVHADLLLDVIKDDAVLPVTIGVFGDWGSGKSSILKIIRESLSGEGDELKDGTLVIYFNGWVFEGYDDAKAALLESIIEKFEKFESIKDKINKLRKSVDWMRVVGLGFKKVIIPSAAAYLTGGLSLIPFLTKELSKFDAKTLGETLTGDKSEEFLKSIMKEKDSEENKLVREFRDEFKEMIDASEIKKLVVIIDDLDRCAPERLIENLEAIKLFLNVEKTAFIIGADPRIVRHAIEHRYKTDGIENAEDLNSRNKRIVSDYLEKLIQVPYILPKLSDNEVETYITMLYCKKELDESFSKVMKAFEEQRAKNRYGVFGFGDIQGLINEEEKIKLSESVSLIASLSAIITEGLNGNPRQIKRFLNTFTLRNRLVKVAHIIEFRIEILAKLMVLEYASPELFRKIYDWQIGQNGEPKELMELETLSSKDDKDEIKKRYQLEWANDMIIRWLKIEPKLSKIDLRDYFWISRDQLTGSISGSSLIPMFIRSLYAKLKDHGSGKILVATVQNEVMALKESETEQLLSLLEKEIAKTPENGDIHKVYIELMANKIPNSINSYSKIVQTIDNTNIPFSLRNELQLAIDKNPEVRMVIDKYSPKSSIGKAVKESFNKEEV